eukprot:4254128-Amphidinium_carterae.1
MESSSHKVAVFVLSAWVRCDKHAKAGRTIGGPTQSGATVVLSVVYLCFFCSECCGYCCYLDNVAKHRQAAPGAPRMPIASIAQHLLRYFVRLQDGARFL